MTSRPAPSQAYLYLLDRLHEDISDTPELAQASVLDRAEVMARAEVRAGKLRFATAKRDLQSAAKRTVNDLSDRVIAHARSILEQLASEEPAFKAKYSLAFRSGKELPDEEVLQILRELQTLGLNLDDLVADAE